MKKSGLTAVVLVILAVILGVILYDFISKRPDRRGPNPYELDVEQYAKVDEALISHRETRKFSLGSLTATGIWYHKEKLYLVGDSSLVILSTGGTPEAIYSILPEPTCIAVDDSVIYVGYYTFVAKYDHHGNLLQQWQDLGRNTVITSLAIKGERLYVADAGNRRIVIFDQQGGILKEFKGERDSESGNGFVVPSPNFDVVVNSYGEVWVVNPGQHALENYTDDGQLRGYWELSSVEIDGFLGCCNPAEITVREDGAFVTSEKGIVRIKTYDQSGRLTGVVAPPSLFKKDGNAPEVCVDEMDQVYALDFDTNMVRVFEPLNDKN